MLGCQGVNKASRKKQNGKMKTHGDTQLNRGAFQRGPLRWVKPPRLEFVKKCTSSVGSCRYFFYLKFMGELQAVVDGSVRMSVQSVRSTSPWGPNCSSNSRHHWHCLSAAEGVRCIHSNSRWTIKFANTLAVEPPHSAPPKNTRFRS